MTERSRQGQDFHELVDALTQDHWEVLPDGHEPIQVATGRRSRFAKVPGLLSQLEASVQTSRNPSGGGRQFAPLPLNAAALDLLQRLTREISDVWVGEFLRPVPFGDPANRLREWAGVVSSDNDSVAAGGQAWRAIDWVQHLIDEIEAVLNPVRTEEITDAWCPACGQSHHRVTADDGTERVSWALQVVKEIDGRPTQVRCLCCRTSWLRPQFVVLARVLEAEATRRAAALGADG